MNVEKFLIILFVLITFLVSVGGVFAEDINVNETLQVNTSSTCPVSSDANSVLIDNSLYADNNQNQNNTLQTNEDDLVANFTSDVNKGINSLTVNFTDTSKGNPTVWLWDFGDGFNSTQQNPTHTYNQIGYFNVTLKVSAADGSSDSIVQTDFIHVCYSKDILANPDFEQSSRIVGWDYSASSIYSFQKNIKSGRRCVQIANDGFISQVVNLDTVDYIGFWYRSTTQGACVNVLLDDEVIQKYSGNVLEMGIWEFVLLNFSDVTGFHTLKFTQSGGNIFLDSFEVIQNDDILVNFTLTSFSLNGDNLTLSFNDYSYGLIDGWLWDFGDDATSTSQNVTHSFKTGHYRVILTVYNENTTKTMIYDIPITFPSIVGSDREFGSVQDAINNANKGNVINIPYNIFYSQFKENLIIDKDLTLNFFNCILLSDGVNPVISVTDGANVIINNISFDNASLKTDQLSKLTINQLNSGNITLTTGNFEFKNTNLLNSNINIFDADCIIDNCVFNSTSLLVNGGESKIFNSIFTGSDVAITQTGGKLEITSNIIFDNFIGVNVSGGITSLLSNMFYANNVSLVYNSSSIVYEDNWWGCNNPSYVYSSELVDCDIFQLGGVESPLNSWLILNITQSKYLDYRYYIAGITYYNLTVDFTHNNHGKHVGSYLKNTTLTLTNIDEYIYYESHSYYGNIKKTGTTVNSEICNVSNGFGWCVLSLGYLTSDLTSLNVTVLSNSYDVLLSSNTVQPNITYVTPYIMFDDNLTVEICCEGVDAVIFYTLDGSNPAYSPTRLVYTEPFMVNESTTLHYTVIDRWGNFQKTRLDNIRHTYVSFIKQDVFVEVFSSGRNIYYSLNGSKFGNNDEIGTFKDFYFYYHPFVVFKPTEISTYSENGYDDYAKYYLTLNDVYLYFYSLDFSVNYIRNSTLNTSDAVWSQYQGDVNNTGVTNYSGPLTNQSHWINNNVFSSGSAVVDNKGRIVIGGGDGYLYYLNKLGQVIWRYGTTSRIICTPTIGADGNIYFSNWMNSSVYCISPDGELIWKYNLGDYNTGSSPVFGLDNRLYVLTSNGLYGNMYVFKDGVLLENHTIPFISGSTPVVSKEGLLYLVSARHELVILNFDGSLKQARLIDSNAVVLSDNQNTQISVSIGDDETVYVLNYYRSSYIEYYSSGRYEDSYDSYYFYYFIVNAYYPNGTCKWSTYIQFDGIEGYLTPEFREYVSGTPTYYKNVLYITGNDNLIAVNASNGKLMWMKEISHCGLTASSPLVSNNEILYVTSNNMVYAFNLDADLIWRYTISGGKYGDPISFSSPTLSNDGTLLVTTNQGIYAFRDLAADFTYEHVNGTETTIQFIDKSTNGTNRYYWMFGDGNVSREQNPVHAYASEGKYNVVLLVEHNGDVDLMRNTTIEVIFHDITPPSNVSYYINNTQTSGGVFNQTQYVALNASDEYSSFVIYYTVDGSNPVNSSTAKIYNALIEVEVNTILRAVAVDSAGNWGNVTEALFNITDVVNVESTLVSEIQSLLDNAEPYSKILFEYDVIEGANFTVNKPLNIISNNNTKLIGNGNQPVFTFTENAKGSILNGFTINNTSTGILIKDTSNITVKNCRINASEGIGINILNSENITVKSTEVFGCEEGIIVNNSDSTVLDDVHVSDCYSDGIWVYQSRNTRIVNSVVEDNGKDPYKLNNGDNSFETDSHGRLKLVVNVPSSQSRANNILIDRSYNTDIINNTINRGYFGIRLYHNTNGVVIDNNTIYETVGDAILLSNYYSNVNITHNSIDGCYNGIDFMGYSENVLIKQNTIKLLHEHENDLYSFVDSSLIEQMAGYVYETYFPGDQFFMHCYNGIQVSYPARNFHEGNTVIVDNVVIRLSHRSWEARKYTGYLDAGCDDYGYNLMDGSYSYSLTDFGGATSYHEGKVDLVLDRIGDAKFRLRLINRLDDHYLSEIPEFDVIFTAGGFTQTVKFINDSAIAEFDVAMAVSDIEAIISGEIRKSAHFDIPITEGYSSTNRAFDPGFERGEAYDNPDPVIPKIPPEEDDYKPTHPVNPVTPQEPEEPDTGYGNGTGDGQGNGNGQGTGTGDGNGDSGSFGNGTGNVLVDIISDAQGMIGDALNVTDKVKSENVLSNVEDSQELGEAATSEGSDDSEGMDRSSEGGSDAGSGETVNAYEVSKVINVEENGWQFVIAVVLLSCFVFLGYVYRKRKGDGEDL